MNVKANVVAVDGRVEADGDTSTITWIPEDGRGCPAVCQGNIHAWNMMGSVNEDQSLEINGQVHHFCKTHYNQVRKSETGYPRFGLINDGVLPERFADKPEGEGKPCGWRRDLDGNEIEKKVKRKKKVRKGASLSDFSHLQQRTDEKSDEKYDKLLKKETETHNENVWLKSKNEELEEKIKRLEAELSDLRGGSDVDSEATLPFTDPDEPQEIASDLVSEWIDKSSAIAEGRQKLRDEGEIETILKEVVEDALKFENLEKEKGSPPDGYKKINLMSSKNIRMFLERNNVEIPDNKGKGGRGKNRRKIWEDHISQ